MNSKLFCDVSRKDSETESCIYLDTIRLSKYGQLEEGIAECARVLRPGGKLLIITTRKSLMGKILAVLWRNRVLEPTLLKKTMERVGVNHVQRLRFPWYFGHVNWWGMVILGEKGE